MLKSIVSRRAIVEGGIGFTLANFVPGPGRTISGRVRARF